MIMKTLNSLQLPGIVVIGVTALAGCSSDDDGSNAPTAPLPDATALAATELAGTWSTGCTLEDSGEPNDGYEMDTLSFTADGFEVSSASFSDAGCSTRVADEDDIDLTGTYTLGSAVLTTQGLEATEIDFTAVPPAAIDDASRTLLDLVHIDGGTLYLGEGDFDDITDADTDPRPGTLDLDDAYFRQP